METSSTSVELTHAAFRPNVARYSAVHEFLVRLRYPGRARGTTFQEFVSPYRFPVFMETAGAIGPRTILVRTKAQVAADFVKRLNKKVDRFRTRGEQVNFQRLRPLLSNISGAWFRDMQSANLSAAGVFGPHVDRSDEFQHAEEVGHLRALVVRWPRAGIEYTLMITEAGGVVLYDAFPSEEEEVDLVLDIKHSLLDRCWAQLSGDEPRN